ncbi:hypothetical protein KC19_7G049100 [Ceratodon purpureus]|uniref:Uncharacterized protein n=1 Tax=Ceratodon purpureus TaxID=3225 RepID=A0A8T0H645_CERPU|nr:hypothetical protein KC19_7G049100 [Ceratodon purpureus]
MEREINNGSNGGGFGYGPPRQEKKERKRVNAVDVGNEKGHHTTEGGIAEPCSQPVVKKSRHDDEGSPLTNPKNEMGAGPENTIPEEIGLSKAMEDDIQQTRQRVEYFTNQVSELLEAGRASFLDASTVWEEGIVQVHQKILERWEENIEGLRNLDIVNEEISARLREARDVLQKLQGSASAMRRTRTEKTGAATSDGQ